MIKHVELPPKVARRFFKDEVDSGFWTSGLGGADAVPF
jgi:hypothetical protein